MTFDCKKTFKICKIKTILCMPNVYELVNESKVKIHDFFFWIRYREKI